MTAKIIDGNAVAREIRGECRERVERIVAKSGSPPGLAVIVVGSDPASRLYVRNKIRACADVGIQSFRYDYPVDVKQDAVIKKIAELNEDSSVHGILVQLPLPPSFDIARILRFARIAAGIKHRRAGDDHAAAKSLYCEASVAAFQRALPRTNEGTAWLLMS